MQHAIADVVNGIRGLRAEETPYGIFFGQLSNAQQQQVVAAVAYRERQAMVPDLRVHGLQGVGLTHWELKLLRRSANTYPSGVRGGATGVHKRALEVEREHIGRLAGVDERLYGVQPGPLAHGHRTRPANPGPLISAYDSFGGVTPIVFGYQAEASDGACDLIKALAEAWAPDLAERYVIDSAEAAVGVATDLLREEFGAAVFKAQATVLLDRLRYCMPGHEEAEVRRHTQRKQWLSREAHASCRGRATARFRYPCP